MSARCFPRRRASRRILPWTVLAGLTLFLTLGASLQADEPGPPPGPAAKPNPAGPPPGPAKMRDWQGPPRHPGVMDDWQGPPRHPGAMGGWQGPPRRPREMDDRQVPPPGWYDRPFGPRPPRGPEAEGPRRPGGMGGPPAPAWPPHRPGAKVPPPGPAGLEARLDRLEAKLDEVFAVPALTGGRR